MTTLTSNIGIRFFAITAFISALATGSVLAAQTARSTGNGAYISVSGTDTTGWVWFYLYASKGGTTQAPETYMCYDMYNQCTNQWVAYGGGRIANTALKATKKAATLVISAAGTAGFTTEGYTGSLKLTLAADGLYSSTYSGTPGRSTPGTSISRTAAGPRAATVATGSVLGFDLGSVSASLGEATRQGHGDRARLPLRGRSSGGEIARCRGGAFNCSTRRRDLAII